MRYRIRHRSNYQYGQPVVTSFHRLHLIPRDDHGQRLCNHHLSIEGATGDCSEEQDLFGNRCGRLELLQPYQDLAITGWSEVAVERQLPQESASTPWDRPPPIADPAVDDFRFDSLHVQCQADLAAYAAPSFIPGRPLVAAVADLTRRLQADFTYDPQATDIATPLSTVLQNRRGVCQDFAHLGLACLRCHGLAAAYVSGYLETQPPTGQPRLVGADASHAWIAVNDPAIGWFHADPTNGCLVGERHIVTAIGRDFADVSPICGIVYGGGGAQQLTVAVDVVPESEWSSHPLTANWPMG